jgi:uncharacterized protein (TIGR02001 family)
VRLGPAPGLALLLALSCLAPAARAQVSGGVTAATDYRLRGVSLTDRRGAVTASIVYDHESGVYAGGSLVAHDPARQGPRILGYQAYVGVAGRMAGGPTWDVGVSRVDMAPYFDRRYSVEYTQAYVGLSQGGLSARLSLADDYPRKGVGTAYAEINGAARPAEAWRLTGHLGAQTRLGGSGYRDGDKTRYDVTVGVVRELGNVEAHLSWTILSPRPEPRTSWTRPGLVAGVSVYF